jgi:hypothetical protein
MFGERQDAKERIDDPTQEDLAGHVAGIALPELFQGRNIFPNVGIVGIFGAKDFVQRVQEGSAVLFASASIPLGQAHVVIDIDIMIQNRGLQGGQGRGRDWEGERPGAMVIVRFVGGW